MEHTEERTETPDLGTNTRDEQIAQTLARPAADEKRPVSRAVATREYTFRSQDAQRVYRRTYGYAEKNLYAIDLLSSILLGDELSGKLTEIVETWMSALRKDINEERGRVQILYDQLDIEEPVGYSSPLTVKAYWSSPLAKRYLDLIVQLDQLLAIVNTLWLHDELPTTMVRPRAYSWTKKMIGLSGKCRQLATEVRIAIGKRNLDERKLTPVMLSMLNKIEKTGHDEEDMAIEDKDAAEAKNALQKVIAEATPTPEDGEPVMEQAVDEKLTKRGRSSKTKAVAA